MLPDLVPLLGDHEFLYSIPMQRDAETDTTESGSYEDNFVVLGR